MYDRHREGLLIMYQIDFNKPEHVHFIGIGGISMSGLAEILLDEGFSISGSDSHETALTEHLETKGARVYYGQRAANIEREPGISVVVYTAAIHEDNPEFRAARDQGLPMLSRAELLGDAQLQRSHSYFRNPWQDHNHVHAHGYSPGRRSGSHHLRGRYFKGHRRQHPCGRS